MTTMPHECGPDGNMKSAPQYICELAAWGRKMEARVAELETALGSLYALVQGESPQLLEDDHHDGIVRCALRLD